jgi:acid phosphatase class B
MATLTVQSTSLAGDALTTTAAAAGGDEFVNTGRELFYVVNASGSTRTVTFTGQNASNFNVTSNNAVVVAGSSTYTIGSFKKDWFNDTNEKVQVTYSDSAADLTVAVIQMPSTTDSL